MASNKRLRRRVAPFVDPNERIDAVFPAQTGASPWLNAFAGGLAGGVGSALWQVAGAWWWAAPLIGAVGILAAFATTGWILVATDRRLLVLAAGRWRRMKPVRVDAELPRQKFGRRSGLWTPIRVGDRVMRVHRRFAGAMADGDDALTREGDRSIPEPIPGPSMVRKVVVGTLAVATVLALVVGVAVLAAHEVYDPAESTAPVSPLQLLASGTFGSGHDWRVHVYRNVDGRACSRTELVRAPMPPTPDPLTPEQPMPMAMTKTEASSGTRRCSSRFPDNFSGIDGLVYAGTASAKIVSFQVRPCAGAPRELTPLFALGETWIAVGLAEPTREIVGLDEEGDVVDRYVVEKDALEADGKIFAAAELSYEERRRSKSVQVSPCDRRWSDRNR